MLTLTLADGTQLQVTALSFTAPEPDYRFLRDVTGYTGGGSSLDGLATAGRTFGVVEFIHATHGPRRYLLADGSEPTDSPGIIRPDDFDPLTNARVWKSI